MVNPHVHLEFSATNNRLFFGDFIGWLDSVLENRDKIFSSITNESMKKQLDFMYKTGITTIGEISSSGVDLEVCINAKQRVVFFNEAIGNNENFVDMAFEDFEKRYKNSEKYKNKKFIPATSVHSPYSTHSKLTQKVIDFTNKNSTICSTHFLESTQS